MILKAGDKVRLLNEVGGGQILKVDKNRCLVLRDDGFEDWYSTNELILSSGDFSVDHILNKDYRPQNLPKRIQVKKDQLEVDLHFYNLVEHEKNYSNYEKLQIQLNEARKNIDKARKSGIKKIVLIHGVGEGVLKEEIHRMLERMERLNFYDANFLRYGEGATEIELF